MQAQEKAVFLSLQMTIALTHSTLAGHGRGRSALPLKPGIHFQRYFCILDFHCSGLKDHLHLRVLLWSRGSFPPQKPLTSIMLQGLKTSRATNSGERGWGASPGQCLWHTALPRGWLSFLPACSMTPYRLRGNEIGFYVLDVHCVLGSLLDAKCVPSHGTLPEVGFRI